VKDPNEADWGKLVRLMTKKKRLSLSAGDLHCIKWNVVASFAVHPDFKSHTDGATASFEDGKDVAQSMSRKQKLSTKMQHMN
jgi:hypothetical protein